MNRLTGIWTYIWSKPYLAAPLAAFAGVVGNALYDEATTGHFAWTSLKAALSAGAGAAVIALHQLYMPAPAKGPSGGDPPPPLGPIASIAVKGKTE